MCARSLQPEHSSDALGNYYYTVECRVEAPLECSDVAEYFAEIHGEILQHGELPDGMPAPPTLVGSIIALRLFGGRAINESVNLWDECDGYTQESSDLYRLLFSRGYEFRKPIQRLFPDALSPDVLLIGSVRITPDVRGLGLGLRSVRRVIDLFEPEGGLVVMKPFPMQFDVTQRKQEKPDPDLRVFTCSEQDAFAKLRRYWGQLGFRQIPKTEYFALCPAEVNPSIRDLDDHLGPL